MLRSNLQLLEKVKRMRRFLTLLAITAAASATASAADAAHGPSWVPEFLTHPATNVAFAAMATFLLIVWRVGGFKTIISALDTRAEKIEAQLNEAKDLHEAAATMLAEAERKQKQADKDAKDIVAQARKDAEVLMKDARQALADRLERREAIAEARIKQAETEAASQVRHAAANAATRAAKTILAEQAGTEQFEAAANEIEKALN